ncbi:hypothetical protein YC2023_115974 [Brassica napus]
MSAIYEDHKDEDGFLYMTYSRENTFIYHWEPPKLQLPFRKLLLVSISSKLGKWQPSRYFHSTYPPIQQTKLPSLDITGTKVHKAQRSKPLYDSPASSNSQSIACSSSQHSKTLLHERHRTRLERL